MANEIEELLGENKSESDSSKAPADKNASSGNGEGDSDKKPTAVEELEALQKAKDALARDKEKIQADIDELRGIRRDLRQGNPQGTTQVSQEQKPAEQTQVQDEPPADYEGWKKLIDKRSEDNATKAVSKELTAIKDSQRKKAYKKFIESHPEYSPSSDPEDKKFQNLLETYKRVQSRTDMDADDILEDLEDSYAVLHRSEILERDKATRRAALDQEISTADIAASSPASGERETGEAIVLTPSEQRMYKEVLKNMPNMSVQTFKKRLKEQEG